MKRLAGKIALVVGGSCGIGAGIVRKLLLKGLLNPPGEPRPVSVFEGQMKASEV